MNRFLVAATLMMASSLSLAQLPCAPLQIDCSRNFARLNTTVELASARPGDANFNYAIGGSYGDYRPSIVVTPTRLQADLQVRGSESVFGEAFSSTTDGLVFANAAAEVNLQLGRIRARIDGFEAVLPPQSFFESTGAEVTTALQETVYFQLPSSFSGGRATFVWTVDGSLSAAASRTSPSDPTFAEARVSAGGLTTTRRWTAPGTFLELLSADTLLPALPDAVIPVTFTSQLLLRSGAGAGGFDVDLYNTATLSIVVPDGVTWSSESGLLLAAVPEPSTFAMFAIGAALLISRLIRQAANERTDA
jgi:PEP-CTERM motif